MYLCFTDINKFEGMEELDESKAQVKIHSSARNESVEDVKAVSDKEEGNTDEVEERPRVVKPNLFDLSDVSDDTEVG